MAKVQDVQIKRDQIKTYLEEWQTRKSVDEDEAFELFSIETILQETYNLTDDDVVNAREGAGPNDRGIDGWYFGQDDDGYTLHIIQAKNTVLEEKEVSANIDFFTRLFPANGNNQFWKVANENIRGEVSDFEVFARDLSRSISVSMTWTTSSNALTNASNYLDNYGNEITLNLDGNPRKFPVDLAILDITDITEKIGVVAKVVPFETVVPKSEVMVKEDTQSVRTLTFACKGSDLAELYRKEQKNLFRLNPRFFQGKSKGSTNAGMADTLLSSGENFYIFNNGITAVCESYQTTPVKSNPRDIQKLKITATDFQIVNGCQTTVSLYQASQKTHLDNQGIFVQLKLIETGGAAMAPSIAKYTNSQNKMHPADLRSNDDIHSKLQKELQAIKSGPVTGPWFYDYKSGEWATNYRTKTMKDPYADATKRYGSFRWFNKTHLAQASLAFLGGMKRASEATGSLWNSDSYAIVFPDNLSAYQILLPRMIVLEIEHYLKQNNIRSGYDSYLKFATLNIIGNTLREAMTESYQPPAANVLAEYFNRSKSVSLLSNIQDWSPALIKHIVTEIISHVQSAAARTGIAPRTEMRTGDTLGFATDSIQRQLLHDLRMFHTEIDRAHYWPTFDTKLVRTDIDKI